MAKVLIKFNAAVIKEIEISKDEITFGRKSSNDIVIDNPAISGSHGKIFRDGTQFFVEDLGSTNGTYLNGQKVKKSSLKNKDQIGIARHVLEFVADAAPQPAVQPVPTPTPAPAASTAPPHVEKPLTPLIPAEDAPSKDLSTVENGKGTPPPPVPSPIKPVPPKESETPEKPALQIHYPSTPKISHPKSPDHIEMNEHPSVKIAASTTNVAFVRVLAGSVNGQSEIRLKDLVTYIGTSDQAAIKIKGFLAPTLAAAISRRPEGYFLKAVKSGYPKVNGKAIEQQVFLENGALIEAGGTNMMFYVPDADKKEAPEK